jgi:hypothetical protein
VVGHGPRPSFGLQSKLPAELIPRSFQGLPIIPQVEKAGTNKLCTHNAFASSLSLLDQNQNLDFPLSSRLKPRGIIVVSNFKQFSIGESAKARKSDVS